jgi:hypothetical protein
MRKVEVKARKAMLAVALVGLTTGTAFANPQEIEKVVYKAASVRVAKEACDIDASDMAIKGVGFMSDFVGGVSEQNVTIIYQHMLATIKSRSSERAALCTVISNAIQAAERLGLLLTQVTMMLLMLKYHPGSRPETSAW